MRAVSFADVRQVVKNSRVLLVDAEQRQRLGARLRGLRTEQRLGQIEVARRAGISPGTLQTIESGGRQSRDQNVEKVARVLGTTLEALLQKPNIDPGDPLLKGLNREDFEVARAYHEASTIVRDRVRHVVRDRDPQQLPPAMSTEVTVLAARIARLITRLSDTRRELLIELVIHLEKDLEDKIG